MSSLITSSPKQRKNRFTPPQSIEILLIHQSPKFVIEINNKKNSRSHRGRAIVAVGRRQNRWRRRDSSSSGRPDTRTTPSTRSASFPPLRKPPWDPSSSDSAPAFLSVRVASERRAAHTAHTEKVCGRPADHRPGFTNQNPRSGARHGTLWAPTFFAVAQAMVASAKAWPGPRTGRRGAAVICFLCATSQRWAKTDRFLAACSVRPGQKPRASKMPFPPKYYHLSNCRQHRTFWTRKKKETTGLHV